MSVHDSPHVIIASATRLTISLGPEWPETLYLYPDDQHWEVGIETMDFTIRRGPERLTDKGLVRVLRYFQTHPMRLVEKDWRHMIRKAARY